MENQPAPSRTASESGLVLLVGVISGAVTVFGFGAQYGLIVIGLVTVIFAALGIFHLLYNEDFFTWVSREHHTLTISALIITLAGGVLVMMWGVFGAYTIAEWFRPEYTEGPIPTRQYLGPAAPWQAMPAKGAPASVQAEFLTQGWKRLMNKAMADDPVNQQGVKQQLVYVESVPFNRSYRTFVAELELPTSTEIDQVFAFLVTEPGTNRARPHEQLQAIRADKMGTDVNKCHVIVSAPEAGERLQIFVIARSQANFPKDAADRTTLRSIR